jgi:hypothetical protein
LRHLTKKTTASEATFWACSDMCRSNFHAGNRNKRDAGFLLRIFYFFNLYFFLGTQQQTLLTSCWRRPQVTPNSREPAGISPARHLVWTQDLFRILWCSQSDDHSQKNLAKFDNILDMKVEEDRIVL